MWIQFLHKAIFFIVYFNQMFAYFTQILTVWIKSLPRTLSEMFKQNKIFDKVYGAARWWRLALLSQSKKTPVQIPTGGNWDLSV